MIDLQCGARTGAMAPTQRLVGQNKDIKDQQKSYLQWMSWTGQLDAITII